MFPDFANCLQTQLSPVENRCSVWRKMVEKAVTLLHFSGEWFAIPGAPEVLNKKWCLGATAIDFHGIALFWNLGMGIRYLKSLSEFLTCIQGWNPLLGKGLARLTWALRLVKTVFLYSEITEMLAHYIHSTCFNLINVCIEFLVSAQNKSLKLLNVSNT